MKVLIVGAGPVGLVGAHLLAQFGAQVTLVEKLRVPSTHPSAHLLHPRSMEVLREIGMAAPILDSLPPADEWMNFVYCKTMLGPIYRTHSHVETEEFRRLMRVTDLTPAHFPQHKLTALLRTHLPASVQFLQGEEFQTLEQGNSGVRATCASGLSLEADYLVAADGARSAVRSAVHIGLEGTPVLQSFLNLHFTSKTLGAAAAKHPGMLYHVLNEEVVAVLVQHAADEFIMQVPFFPSLQHISDVPEHFFVKLIDAAAGQALSDVSIKSRKLWKMTGRYAQALQADRVFLVGDAAHQMPPSGGFGLNTGIGDVHNLCWKLYYPELLPSYAVERTARVKEVTDLALSNFDRSVALSKHFGLDVYYANAFKTVSEWLPFGENLFRTGMAYGQQWLFSDSAATEYLSKDKHLLQLLFPKQDIEYQYSHGFCEGSSPLAPHRLVTYKHKQYPLRQLPAVISAAKQQPTFLLLQGSQPTHELSYPTVTVTYPGEVSYYIRPDSHVHHSSRASS